MPKMSNRIGLDCGARPRDHMLVRQLSLILLLTCAACSAARPTSPVALPVAHADDRLGKSAASADILAAIQAALGDAACDRPQQCHSMAIGAKPCGGPDGYLAWSSKRTDEQTLRPLVARHALARKQENLRSDMLSTCVFEVDPGVTCQAARCTLRARQPAGRSCLTPAESAGANRPLI